MSIVVKFVQKGYPLRTAADRYVSFSSEFLTLKINSTYSVSGATPNNNSGSVTSIDTGTNTFTSAGHGLANGELLNFDATSAPGGVEIFVDEGTGAYYSGLYYYVINKTTNTFQISLTPGGSAVDVTSTGSDVVWYTDNTKIVINHNLGYFSPWIFVWNGSSVSGLGESIFMSYGLATLHIRIYENSTEIYMTSDFASSGETYYFTCYQFLEDFDSYTAPIVSTDTSTVTQSETHGFKIAKPNNNVFTASDEDLIASSSFFTNIVHKKGVDTTGSVSHSLGYVPSFLAFLKKSGKTYLGQSSDIMSITTTTLDSVLGAGESLYYVIFKQRSV